MQPRLPQVIDNQFHPIVVNGVDHTTIAVGSAAWYAWLADDRNRSFSLTTATGRVTVRREQKRHTWYWYAYQRRAGKLHKAYVGRTAELTPERLQSVLATLIGEQPQTHAVATQIFLLGQSRILHQGQAVVFPALKAFALLAYLAVQRVPQSRDHLLALFWPESPTTAARKNLRNTLWQIRSLLGSESILDQQTLALDPSIWVDVQTFEQRAQETVTSATLHELYGGPLLAGFALDDAADFEVWLTTERERLARVYIQAITAQIAADRAHGNWQAIVAAAHQALPHDPLNEALYRALMEGYARLGQRSEALHQYDLLRDTLERELKLAPLPESEALRQLILVGEIQAPPAPATACFRTRPDRPALFPFVGRERELTLLREELQRVGQGQVRAVVITGELGIGKTWLWQQWLDQADRDLLVLEAHCLPTTQSIPFAPLLKLFLSRPPHAPEGAPPLWVTELKRLLASHQPPSTPFVPTALTPPQIEERHRIFEAFVHVVRMLAEQPVVLWIDDIQWADQSTIEWLAYLAAQLRTAPLLIVTAYRREEASAPLVRLMAEWGRAQVMRRIELERFTYDEARKVVEALGANSKHIDEWYAQCAGNPYYLTELIRTQPGTFPTALVDIVRARIETLPETARRLLQAAVVLEPEIDFQALQRTAGRAEEETLDALDALLASDILYEKEASYRFSQPFVALIVRDSISAARRSVLHRRAAEAIETLHIEQLPQVAGQLASHYAAAGDPQRSAQFADLAADHALSLAALSEAIHFYQHALAVRPTATRYINLGQVFARQGATNLAREAFAAGLALAETEQQVSQIMTACLGIAITYLMDGTGEQVVAWAKRSLGVLSETIEPALQARSYFLLGAGLSQLEQQLDDAEQYLTTAGQIAEAHGVADMIGATQFELGNLLARRGNLSGAVKAFQRAVDLAACGTDIWPAVLAHNNAAYHAMLAGDNATAHTHVEHGLRLAEEHELDVPKQWLYSTKGEIALAEQRWDDAEQWLTMGLPWAQRFNNQAQIATYQANLGLVARGRGDLDSAVLQIEQARELVSTLHTPHLQIQIDLWLTELYHERGEATAARSALERAEQRLVGNGYQRLAARAAELRCELSG
jgi:DNA-binding SARP family transcriptional activator